MIDAIRLTFAALREAGHAEPGRLSVRGVDGGPSGLRLGLDADGRSHLLVEADADAEIIRVSGRVGGDLCAAIVV